MNTCDDIRGRLTLYLDNELQGDERARVEAHLSECESCAAILARELNFLNAVRESGPLHVASPGLRAKVEAILNAGQTSAAPEPRVASRAYRRGSRLSWVVAAAAVLLVLLLPILVWRVMKQSEATPNWRPSSFALMAAETHLRRTRGQLPLEVETESPKNISNWFSNKVMFSSHGCRGA